MRLHILHDGKGNVSCAGTVAPGMHAVLVAPKGQLASTVEVDDVEMRHLHSRIRDVGANYKVELRGSTAALVKKRKAKEAGG